MSKEIVIAVGILAVVLVVALCAIAKGRGFKFAAQRGKTKLEVDIAGKQEDSSKPSGESGNIKDVSVLSEGKVEGGDVDIHIGHNIDKKTD